MCHGNTAQPDNSLQPQGPQRDRSAWRTVASHADNTEAQLATQIARIMVGGFYRPGQTIPIEQLSCDADAPPEVTRRAVLRLHRQGALELAGSAAEITRGRPAGETAAARAAQRLRERIAAGTYPPGTKLPTQEALARALQASTATIVKALGDLAHQGWVIRKPNRTAIAALPAHAIRSVRIPAPAPDTRTGPAASSAPGVATPGSSRSE